MPNQIGALVYNLWQDPTNVRGLWRRTTAASYATAAPAWETVLDLDKLSADEKANWVWGGANCPPPNYRHCLVSLSNGGEDASTLREFDLTTKSFVEGGFILPTSKQNVDWLDDNTLILSRDWGPGTMTASSYPFIVKVLKRGQSLAQATEVFRGKPEDVSVSPSVLHDGDGHKLVLIIRATDFFHSETYELTPQGVAQLYVPSKNSGIGLVDGQLVFQTLEDWRGYHAGDLIAYAPADLVGLAPKSFEDKALHLIFSPGPRQSVETAATTAHRVVATIYDNVRGSLVSFAPRAGGGWTATRTPVAANSSVNLISASEADERLYYSVENFLAPTHLFEAHADHRRPSTSRTCRPVSTRTATRSTSTKRRRRTARKFPTSSSTGRT